MVYMQDTVFQCFFFLVFVAFFFRVVLLDLVLFFGFLVVVFFFVVLGFRTLTVLYPTTSPKTSRIATFLVFLVFFLGLTIGFNLLLGCMHACGSYGE